MFACTSRSKRGNRWVARLSRCMSVLAKVPLRHAGGIEEGAQQVDGAFPNGNRELHGVVCVRQPVPGAVTT